MTLRLDPPRRIGGLVVAALCEQRVTGRVVGGVALVQGHKLPLAVVVAEGGTLTARDLAGNRLDLAVVEAACPGLRARMAEAG